MTEYDAVVIGLGTGGEGAMWALQREGLRLAVVERELVGGLCAYWGCMPSKTLLRPGDIDWEASHGVGIVPPAADWREVADYRDYICRNWDDTKQVEGIRQTGMDFFRGDAVIANPGEVRVNGEALRTKRIIVATGSAATVPPIDGLEEAGYWTNREGTALQAVPKSVLVLGGGAVGCELGQMLHGFGARVAIVEESGHLLGHESPQAASYVRAHFERIGIEVHTGRQVVRVDRDQHGRAATLDDGTVLRGEVVLVATGRHPQVTGLGLEGIGIHATGRGISVDEHCRAGENVWAIGDVTGVAGFTHIAYYQSQIAADDILGRPRAANYNDIPAVTFVDPEVASVGITDESKAPDGMEIVSVFTELDSAARTVTYGKGYHGGLRLLADRNDRVLVGGWAVGPLAGEWIHLAALAIRARVPLHVLDDTILAFPTFSRLYLGAFEELRRKIG